MTFTRRQFLSAAAVTGAAIVPIVRRRLKKANGDSPSPDFSYPGVRYPLLLTGEQVVARGTIESLEFFKPLFGRDRPAVNPTVPRRVDERTLAFDDPGEYYLNVDGRPLKVVVFARGERMSAAVLRLFHFCVANSLYIGLEDNAWYRHRGRFLDAFFTSRDPIMLSCGPTHSVFRELVAARFALPTRIVNLSAIFYSGNAIARTTHNVPEVYLPDVGKFVLIDINSGYVARWLDAFDLTEVVRSKWVHSTVHAGDRWTDLGLDLVHDVDPMLPSRLANTRLAQQTADVRTRFTPELVSDVALDRTSMFRVFLSGPIYWGNSVGYVQPTGTEFLSGDCVYAAYETDMRLRQELIDWQRSFELDVDAVPPGALRGELARGAASLIAQREWEQQFPAS